MEPHAVVIGFDVLEDHLAGLPVRGRRLARQALGFERAPERLHRGVVVAVAASAHAGPSADLAEQLPVSVTGILATLVAVDDEARAGTAPLPGGAQTLADEGGLQSRSGGPTD